MHFKIENPRLSGETLWLLINFNITNHLESVMTVTICNIRGRTQSPILDSLGTTSILKTGPDYFLEDIGSKLTEWWPSKNKIILKFKTQKL